jgi:1,4-alpha-glucan branching enzyme
MKALFTIVILMASIMVQAQIVKIEPATASADDEVKLIYNATLGNGALVGAAKVYLHSGVVTSAPSGTEFNNVKGNWGQDDGVGLMTKVPGEADQWEITLSPSAREYYGVGDGVNIFRLAMVFRNADGAIKGAGTEGTFQGGSVIANGDIFVDLAVAKFVVLNTPVDQDYFLGANETIMISATASADVSLMELLIDEGSGFAQKTLVTTGRTIQYDFAPTTAGSKKIKVTATIAGETVAASKTISVNFVSETKVLPLPSGLEKGINYSADLSQVSLVLEAPNKRFVYAVGDFSDWAVNADYLMNKTPDGELYWITLKGITPQQKYVFQYWVDGTIRVGDPYADEVADPWNDKFIDAITHSDLPVYDKTDYGIATTFETGQTEFDWETSETTWQRPARDNLIIYELLVRDFVATHSYKTLIDTLDYLKNLGINAIELMPIMEFEGNESWGYNPSYFFAPDKYYGTKADLKNFIQICHQNGIAVIVDMVLNHAFGQNPNVMMYFEGDKPAANSPWFNRDATHPFNVGYDFNHESTYTQAFVDSVNAYWLKEYHVDGYRFDLSKGFTQKNNPNDVNAWSAFDQSRIDLLKRMASKIREVESDAYIILEHFGDSQEETVLAAEGMVLWRNKGFDYYEALGGKTNVSFSGAEATTHVSYMESHDEQRQLYEVFQTGNAQGNYNTRDTTIALERIKMNAAFFFTLPGPKMLWQFGELGYDIDINFNDRVGNKPFPWGNESNSLGYYENPLRKYVYDAFSAIINLRTDRVDEFKSANYTYDFSGAERSIIIDGPDLDIVIVGNFGLQSNSISQHFTTVGTWHDLFSGEEVEIPQTTVTIPLQPGEFHIYTSQKISEGLPNVVQVYQNPVTINPTTFASSDEIVITFDAAKADPDGTAGLVGAAAVFMNAGIVFTDVNSEVLQNVVNSSAGQMTKVANEADQWEIRLTPSAYFSISSGAPVRIGMTFRDAEGTNFGKGFRGSVVFFDLALNGKLITITPSFFDQNTEITLTFDARFGNKGLVGASKVYMHSSVSLSESSTEFNANYIVGNWGADDGLGAMTQSATNADQWEITMTPADYYSLQGAGARRLTMVFRNADGSRKGAGTPGDFENGVVLANGDVIYNIPGIVTGIEDELPNFSYYPNPSNGVINFSGEIPGRVQEIKLQDLNGNTVLTKAFPSGTLSPVDANAVAPGLYLMRIITDRKGYTLKVLIQQ